MDDEYPNRQEQQQQQLMLLQQDVVQQQGVLEEEGIAGEGECGSSGGANNNNNNSNNGNSNNGNNKNNSNNNINNSSNKSTKSPARARPVPDSARRNALREANRIHCKETRERKKKKEQLLREEVEILQLCKVIVEHGPDLFSLHRMEENAPFRFLCENFCQRLQVAPEEIIGQPLASIVDPRDQHILGHTVLRVLERRPRNFDDGSGMGDFVGGGTGEGPTGILVYLRVTSRGLTCHAGMTISIGSQGLIVVTRLYGS